MKLIYTISNFHNPMGVALSLQRRHELLRLAAEHGAYILDDDAELHDGAEVALIRAAYQEPLRAELGSFLRVACGEETPRVGAGDAIAAMRVVEALMESAQRGEALALPVGDGA